MKKFVLLLLLLFGLGNLQSCSIFRKSIRQVKSEKIQRIVAESTSIKHTITDSLFVGTIEKYTHGNSNIDLSIDKIERTEELPEKSVRFILNIDSLKTKGDTIVAVDKNTGTKATIYRSGSNMQFDVKAGRQRKTFVLSGLRLKSSGKIDSGNVKTYKNAVTKLGKDSISNHSKIDTQQKIKNNKQSQMSNSSTTIYWVIGLVILVIGVLFIRYLKAF